MEIEDPYIKELRQHLDDKIFKKKACSLVLLR